jgi:hypothetical protein
MTALAQAAGWPFDLVTAPPQALQAVTLDCGQLAQLCNLQEADSEPVEMVEQWKANWI